MTAGMIASGSPGARAARGALLTVSIGASESVEWAGDLAFRTALRRDVARRARERGRRFYEIRDAAGVLLDVGEVAL